MESRFKIVTVDYDTMRAEETLTEYILDGWVPLSHISVRFNGVDGWAHTSKMTIAMWRPIKDGNV